MVFKLAAALLVAMTIPVVSLASGHAPVTVDVEGYADVAAGEREAARERALQNAFRRAIEQVLGVMVDSQTVVRNSELINDRILSSCSGFIKSYRITGESVRGDTFRLDVRATVSAVRLEKGLDEIGLLSKRMGKPRIALVMNERNCGEGAQGVGPTASGQGPGIAESVIPGVLARKGYNLVDRQTMIALARRDGAAAVAGEATEGDAVVQAAAGGGAEVVILGRAMAQAGSCPLSGTNLRSCEAHVSARAVDADTGQVVVETILESERVVNVNPYAGGAEAIRKASQRLADRMNRQLAEKWKKRAAGTRTARVTIRGVEYCDIARLLELMRQRLNCVEETFERSFRDGVLNLDLEITGTAAELAEEVTRAELKGFGFRVISFTGNTLSMQLIK